MELKGTKINFLGDSITEGAGTSSHDKMFTMLIEREYGAICQNYGIGGTRLATYTNSAQDESEASAPRYRVYFRAPPNSSTV